MTHELTAADAAGPPAAWLPGRLPAALPGRLSAPKSPKVHTAAAGAGEGGASLVGAIGPGETGVNARPAARAWFEL